MNIKVFVEKLSTNPEKILNDILTKNYTIKEISN
jgi:hypothetical protein